MVVSVQLLHVWFVFLMCSVKILTTESDFLETSFLFLSPSWRKPNHYRQSTISALVLRNLSNWQVTSSQRNEEIQIHNSYD